jgi:probable HAF family extracellular repeat protein
LPGSTGSSADGINDAGQAVGVSTVGGVDVATEWSGGSVIDLGRLPGSTGSSAVGINEAGQAVGFSIVGGVDVATEWSGGSVIDLGGLPSFTTSAAQAINDAGQVVGYSDGLVPESSTWAMMLFGFVGLGVLALRRKRKLTSEAAHRAAAPGPICRAVLYSDDFKMSLKVTPFLVSGAFQ